MDRRRLLALQSAKSKDSKEEDKKEFKKNEIEKIEEISKSTQKLVPIMKEGEIVEDEKKTAKFNNTEEKDKVSMSSGQPSNKQQPGTKIIPKSKVRQEPKKIFYRTGGEVKYVEDDEYKKQLQLEKELKGLGIDYQRVYLS